MIDSGVLKETAIDSPLGAASTLKPKGGKRAKNLVATVILTSLVDAFSILVIYLLVSSSNSGEVLYLSKDMELPQATQVSTLQRNTLVKVEKNRFFIENQEVDSNTLVSELIRIRREMAEKQQDGFVAKLTVQADRRATYEILNQVVLASSHAGFSEVNFAVLAN